jgi:hypothetical protein
MAIIHKASISPTKAEILERLLGGPATVLGAYRFDDPAGEVGVEGFIAQVGAADKHVVLSYRSAPLDGADEHLVTTMEHTVLGTRWVYDGTADPVARGCFERALRGEQEQAVEEIWDGQGHLETREPTARLSLVPARQPESDATLGFATDLEPDAVAAHTTGAVLVAAWLGGTAAVATLA